MSKIHVNVSAFALVLLTGCGAPITGEWNGVAELDGIGSSRTLGLAVEKDEALRVSGELLDAAAPKRRHAVAGLRVGTVVVLGWEERDGRALDVSRLVGRSDGERIEGFLVCQRTLEGQEPSFCPSLPAGSVVLERGALEIEEELDHDEDPQSEEGDEPVLEE